jgi:hypothetical protein
VAHARVLGAAPIVSAGNFKLTDNQDIKGSDSERAAQLLKQLPVPCCSPASNVIVALAGLFIVPATVFHGLAIGAITVVVAAVAVALTLLSLLGDKINWLHLPGRGVRKNHEDESGFFGRTTAIVLRHPVISIVGSVAILVAAAAPFLTINLGGPGVSDMPSKLTSVQAFRVLDREFSAGRLGPAVVVIKGDVQSAERQRALNRAPSSASGWGRFSVNVARNQSENPMTFILAIVGVGCVFAAMVAAIVGNLAPRFAGYFWFAVPILLVSSFGSCAIALQRASGPSSRPLPPAPFPEAATRFEDFPVYWLGSEYRGLPLTIVVAPAPRSPATSVLLGYGGSCKRSFESSCAAAIYVEVRPACAPDDLPTGYPDAYAWTSSVVVHMYGKDVPSSAALTLAYPDFFSPEPFAATTTSSDPC